MTTNESTEADAIAELAQSAVAPKNMDTGGARMLYGAYPPGWQLHQLDLEHYEAEPRRARGTTTLHTAASFLAQLDQQGAAAFDLPLPVYLDPKNFRATAVFNDHDASGPGWRDHRAILQLQPTDEWLAWDRADREFLDAQAFAEFVEEWRHTIADPPAADILDMVRSFRATTRVTFRQEVVEKSGDRALEYVEETQAAAGRTGKLELPDGFGLVLAPFDGAEPRPLPARFRYRLSEGTARFGVVLEQPALVAKAAFDAEVERINAHGTYRLMVGRPASD
ncbi:MAG: DUF2303 family protein [Candidatus Neomicrothrix subdominans]